MRRYISLAVAALAIAVGMACDDDEPQTQNIASEREAQVAQTGPDQGSQRAKVIEVFDDRVQPRELMLQTGENVQVQIVNRGSSACTFYIGEFLRGVQVAPGQTVPQSISFTGSGTQAQSSTRNVDMGCDGDAKRKGNVVVEFRGVR